MANRPRLVIGMSGSSAPQLAVAMMERLRELDAVETHFVMSAGARTSLRLEAGMEPDDRKEFAALRDSNLKTRAWALKEAMMAGMEP